MSVIESSELKQAVALEGFLGKQRPGVVHVYQQRYCKFLDEGLTFAYAASKEEFDQQKIRTQIPLKDVLDVISEAKPKKFQLKLDGRVYKFEATSTQEKEKWVNAIKICKAHSVQVEEHHRKQFRAADDDIRFEDDLKVEDNKRGLVGMVVGATRKLVVEKVMKTGVDIVKGGVNLVGNAILDKSAKSNEEYLKAKKLHEGLERIDSKLLQSRLLAGYMLKETKEATGLSVVDSFVNDAGMRETIARRWCLLISSKPILLDQVDQEDEATLANGALPTEIEQEVLYIYDDSCDNSKPLETVQLKDVIDIVIKNKAVAEQYYRFVLDLGDRKVNMITTNPTERTKWVHGIQIARANIKEKLRSKLPTVKNMYWQIKILADQGEEKLKAKIQHDYDRITNNGEAMGANQVRDMLKGQEKVAEEFLAVINACLSHKDQRIDIIRLYVDIFHEGILSAIRSFFRRNQDNFENRDIYDILKFLITYRDRMRYFGDAFVDQRIVVGLATLSKIVGTRMLKTQMKTIRNIVKQELEKEPEIDGRGKAATTAPSDLFKILNETFNTLSLCNTKEVAYGLLETCAHLIEFFQSGLSCVIEHQNVTIDQLAAFCNNSLVYINNLKEFSKQAEQITQTSRENIARFFDEDAFKKVFIPLGKKAQEKIAHKLFSSVDDQWNNIPFLEIRLDSSLADPIEKMNQLTEKVSTTLTIKIECACLEKVVTFYVQAFLNSAEKKVFRMDEVRRITYKFEDDMRLLGDLFNNLKKNVVEASVGPINNFHDFLTANYAFLPMSVQSMKEQYGNAIRWSTLELLIKLRNDNLGKEEKIDLLRSCEDIYKTTQRKAEKAKNFNVFKHVDQNFDADTTSPVKRGDSTFASFIEEDDISDKNSSSGMSDSSIKKSASALNLEGYLDVEKDEFLSNVGGTLLSNLKYETKYFNLKKDILYYYKDKDSEYSQGSYKLKEMSAFGKTENDDCGFYLTVKGKEGENKTLRFKASTPEKRDVWLDFIKEASALPGYGGMIELNTDIQLFKDTRPLFADIEEMPNLEFTFNASGNTQNKADKNKRKRSFNLDEPVTQDGPMMHDGPMNKPRGQKSTGKIPDSDNAMCKTCSMF